MTYFKKQPIWVAILFVIIFITSCGNKKEPAKTILGEVVLTTSFPVEFNPFPPKDLDSLASDSLLVKFAWEEFLALNWRSSYAIDSKRDTPDNTWNWSTDNTPYPDYLVWETYAHRTELRPFYGGIQPFDDPPHYSFGDSIYKASPTVNLKLFNNLDENNEIGSCNLYAHQNKYGEENMVLFQAKVNRDEYDYIKTNFPTQALLAKAATDHLIDLPAGGAVKPNSNGDTYQGAMEIKTAWRLLVPEDDASQFFTRTAIYYETTSKGVIGHNDTFALIGIHIIHKTKQRPDFVFATWEHVGVEKDNMAYVLLNQNVETGPIYTGYKRLFPIPELVQRANASVHQQIKEKNTNSIWQNYRLIGVQGKPTNNQNSMSYYLANYVIESDSTLAYFYGSSIKTPRDNLPNTTLHGKRIKMGGCMGCHGVAQGKGTDFSFLLDNLGKPVKAPDKLDSLPNTTAKLELYMNDLKN